MQIPVDAKRLEEGDHWGGEQPPTAFLDELRTLLPKDTSWGCCEQFESDREWGSDIRIWHDDEIEEHPIFGIELSLSAGTDGVSLLESFLSLARKFGLQFYTAQSGRVLQPDLERIIQDFEQSTAYRFLSNAESTILDAAKYTEKKTRHRPL